jgi:hypothetical protein
MLFINIYFKKPVAKFSRLVFLCLIVFSNSILADSHLILSPSVDYVFYREFSKTGDTLDTETGFLPGLQVSLYKATSNDFSIHADAYYGSSTIEYDGQLQNGQPYLTDSKMIKMHFQVGVDRAFQKHKFGVFFGVDEWDRHILSRNNTPQLSEYYSWDSLGIKYGYDLENFKIEAELAQLINAGLDVDLTSVGYGVLHAAMPNGTSASLSTSFNLNKYFSGWWLTSTLAGHYFERGRATVTQGISITEPENVTFQLGVSLSYYFDI